jgi:hypothetical protein
VGNLKYDQQISFTMNYKNHHAMMQHDRVRHTDFFNLTSEGKLLGKKPDSERHEVAFTALIICNHQHI